MFEAVIERGNSVGVERVGLDDVGACFEVLALNRLHDARLRDVQHVEVPAQVSRVLQKLRTAKRRFVQLLRLDHRAHGAVQNDDPLLQEILQRGDSCFSSMQRTSPMCKVGLELRRLCECWPRSSMSVTNDSLLVYRRELYGRLTFSHPGLIPANRAVLIDRQRVLMVNLKT